MGDQFFIDVPYISLPDPSRFVDDVNIELDILREQGKADIWFDSLSALDYNIEKGTWFIAGLLSDDHEPNECELALPGLEITLAVALATNKKRIVTHPRRIQRLQIAELIENIKGWSSARGILENGVWYTQATKMYEEDGEGAAGVGKNKRNLIIDAVGDMIVVLVNLLELTGYDSDMIRGMVATVRDPSKAPVLPKMPEAALKHFLYHKMRKSNTNAVDFMWDYGLQLQTKKLEMSTFSNEDSLFIVGNLSECIYYANALSTAYGFSLEEGLSLAWDEIKDRRGFLNADGIFVKESDMAAADKLDTLNPTEQSKDNDGKATYLQVVITDEMRALAQKEAEKVDPEAKVELKHVGVWYSGYNVLGREHLTAEAVVNGDFPLVFMFKGVEFELLDDAPAFTINVMAE